MTNRAILYLRSSKDRSDVSIDAQRRALHETAMQRGLVVVDEFADAVESGKDDDRPAFQRLIHAVKQPGRAWEHVLVLDTSRIARRRLIAMMFERDCAKHQVRLVYKSLPESDPATDMVLRSVLQAFDEYHSLTSRAKGLAGMAENVRQGWRAGGKAPRGYKLDYHATGAVRDGSPVLKSRLIIDELTAGEVRLDVRRRRAYSGGREVTLSAREYALAEVLMQHKGQVLSREQLLSLVWGYDFDPGSNIVDVYVGYVRKKLGAELVRTARGMGYRVD
jgi:DNA invertase Pin-like site-specific DNA recombinase